MFYFALTILNNILLKNYVSMVIVSQPNKLFKYKLGKLFIMIYHHSFYYLSILLFINCQPFIF